MGAVVTGCACDQVEKSWKWVPLFRGAYASPAEKEWLGCAHHVAEGAVAKIVRAVSSDKDERNGLDRALEEKAGGERSRKRQEREKLREGRLWVRCIGEFDAFCFCLKLVCFLVFFTMFVILMAMNYTVSS
jgi:hypothetical protein